MTTSPKPDSTHDDGKPAPRKRGNLVVALAGSLRHAIHEGIHGIGDKLPSEADLTASHGVSRTVVREAIAALRSEGLVEPRQGAGVFVIANRAGTGVPFADIDPHKLASILEILELRTAVEVEAAALAAIRCSPAQEEAIYRRLADIDAALAAGEPATSADFAFHMAIAEATSNPRFREFLAVIGSDLIPRGRLEARDGGASHSGYLALLQAEHRRIADAIASRDPQAARTAMRSHLEGSQSRYRRLLRDLD